MLEDGAIVVTVFLVGTMVGEWWERRHPKESGEITLSEALDILADTSKQRGEFIQEMYDRPYHGRNNDHFYDGRQEGWV